jgi:hypothetical protein
MDRSADRVLFWTPRVLTLFFAAFLALFALDATGHGLSLWHSVVVVGMHLVPTAVVLGVLAVAWRWESVGAGIFFGLAAGYLLMSGRRVHWTAVVMISGSLAVLGALFLITSWLRRQREGPPT